MMLLAATSTVDNLIGLALTVAILVFLIVVLIVPERF